MKRFKDGRGATIAAFLIGLLVATAGTATAAKLITGKQIKDGSVALKDLSKGVRSQLAKAGKPGATGPQGPAGPQGTRGDAGPSTGPAGGDLTGTYPNPELRAGSVGTSEIGAIPAFRASMAANQTVPTNSVAELECSVEQFDIGGIHETAGSPGRATAPVAGIYELSMGARFSNSNTTGAREVTLLRGSTGSDYLAKQSSAAIAEDTFVSASAIAQLDQGEVVSFEVVQRSGASLMVEAAPGSFCAMRWIAPPPAT